MNRRFLFGTLLVITSACRQDEAIPPNPATLVGEVVGTYRTNTYLDLSCVAIPADKLPYAELKVESDSSITFVYTKLYPTKESKQLKHITLTRLSEAVQLRIADSSIGTLQTDRIFTSNGMEKQGPLLRISIPNTPSDFLYFAGVRQ